MHLQANHAPRVTPKIAHATCRKLRPHKECVFQHNSHPCKTEESTPDMICPHTASAMNHQLKRRQVLSAPCAEIPSQKKNLKFKPSKKPNIRNSKFGIPPKPQYYHKRSPYRCTSPRFRSILPRSALSSFRSTAVAPTNTRDTGSQVLSASSGPFQATLTTNSPSLPSGSRGTTLPHSIVGNYVQVGASPAPPPLPLNGTGPPQAFCVQVGHPATPDITRRGARETRYRASSWHIPVGSHGQQRYRQPPSTRPRDPELPPRNPGMSWVVETAASARLRRPRRLARHRPTRTL